ncbi:MAG: hypothetical protein PHW92_12945, partial [Lutibacter sp.]|nr:hypothetical protein [Lutibacter sp.]
LIWKFRLKIKNCHAFKLLLHNIKFDSPILLLFLLFYKCLIQLSKNFEKNFGYLIAGISATYNLKSTISFKNEIFENTNDPYISNLTTSFGYGREFKLYDDFFLDINFKLKRFGWYYYSTINDHAYISCYKAVVITPFCLNFNIIYKL